MNTRDAQLTFGQDDTCGEMALILIMECQKQLILISTPCFTWQAGSRT